jgi:hypothetical protein
LIIIKNNIVNKTNLNNLSRSWLAGGAKPVVAMFVSCALLVAALAAHSQTTVTVDPTQSWIGYMNWSPVAGDAPGYGGSGGGGWGTADLDASFSSTTATLTPNTSISRDVPLSNNYWWNADGSGANNMDASFYVEDSATLPGQVVTFTGMVLANTLVSPYTSVAFIKDFAPDYSSFTSTSVPLTPGAFSINLATITGTHVQYGFETVGPNAQLATVAALGSVQVGPATPVTNGVHASIVSGTQISWIASSANSYQPQKSANNSVWTDFGTVISGNTVTSLFDLNKSPFYRVLEMTPGSAGNGVLNPGFEIPAANAIGAANWNIAVLPNPAASMWVTNQYGAISAHGGGNFLFIESTTPATGPVAAPNTDVRSDFIPVTAGTIYNLSFYAANPVKTGGANPQYDIFFYNSGNNPVGGPIFTSFASVGPAWTQVTTTVTPPTGATQLTIGWIQAMGAGNGWDWVTLIDDVSLSSGPASPGATNTLSATVQSAVGITWLSGVGKTYTVQSRPDVGPGSVWSPFGANVIGTGTNTVFDVLTNSNKFYRVLQDN